MEWLNSQLLEHHERNTIQTDDGCFTLPPNEEWIISVELDPGSLVLPDVRSSITNPDLVNSLIQSSPDNKSLVGKKRLFPSSMIALFVIERLFENKSWAFGTTLFDDEGNLLFANMTSSLYNLTKSQQSLDIDGFKVRSARFCMRRETGELFETYLLYNNLVCRLYWSNNMTQSSFSLYTPGRNGTLITKCILSSVLDCMFCRNRNSVVCQCMKPGLPLYIKPVDSITDLLDMYIQSTENKLMLRELYDSCGNLVDSALTVRLASATRTSQDSLPLFQALHRKTTKIFHHLNTSSVVSNLNLLLTNESNKQQHSSSFSDTHSPKKSSGFGYRITHHETRKKSHNEKFRCDKCNKVFTNGYNLRRHMNSVHSDGFHFVCGYTDCFKKFKLEANLKLHIKSVHLKQTQVECELCGSSFASLSNLNRHQREHHHHHHDQNQDKSLECFKCHKILSNAYNLTRHLKSCNYESTIQ
uniref:C2H2-type domain-containing protein n=1 Tax=Timspurckia oligopyrenoides TaxID=708627 RepID=A0A7S0ZG01_9RHOD